MDTKNELNWEPSIAFLIDLLGIVTLKSIILGCNNPEKKEAYENEAQQIINSLDSKGQNGKLIRAIQIGMLSNRLIWENETKARQGGREQDHLLPFTHTLNGMRLRAGNAIVNQTGGRKDLNLDRVDEDLCKKYGYNFGGLFE